MYLANGGGGYKLVGFIVQFGLFFLYLIFPPTILITVYCRINREIKQKLRGSVGMQQMRAKARSHMLKNMAIQMSIYLFSFWLTWVPYLFVTLISPLISTELLFHLDLFTTCLCALQGFILAGVYFTIPIVAQKQVLPTSESMSNPRGERSVEDIRADAAREALPNSELSGRNNERLSYVFNVFDGTPDEDSPWARFFDDNCDVRNSANVLVAE